MNSAVQGILFPHDILFKLALKSLIICNLVSKTWRSAVRDPRFIGAHLSLIINLYNQNDIHILIHHLSNVSGKSYIRIPIVNYISVDSEMYPPRFRYARWG
ncbi:hypothetical protein DVH24_037734 [Malus domestica]|uniref:F-box domain-containing protein n=1 Tax=Malus domestica TaxID=3750 RepID=A0A498JY84_MALDO|nr:hypothetical protein DVH24_037734 [Malus domestica]